MQKSYSEAADYYRKACDLGDGGGCNNLGVSFEDGKGVKQSYSEAKKFLGKACDMKNDLGCNNYAILNKRGY